MATRHQREQVSMQDVIDARNRLAKREAELELQKLERQELRRRAIVAGVKKWRLRKKAEALAARQRDMTPEQHTQIELWRATNQPAAPMSPKEVHDDDVE